MVTSFFSKEELALQGFKRLGENVQISRLASFYSRENIEIGNNVRIDDFCLLSGEIIIGNNVHISAYNAIYGKFGVEMYDYSGLSPRCTILSATDDFSGGFLIGPMVKPELTNVTGGRIIIEKYCQIGCGSVVFPGVKIFEGAVAGAMTLVNKDLEPWKIYKGIPAAYYKERSKNLLNLLSGD